MIAKRQKRGSNFPGKNKKKNASYREPNLTVRVYGRTTFVGRTEIDYCRKRGVGRSVTVFNYPKSQFRAKGGNVCVNTTAVRDLPSYDGVHTRLCVHGLRTGAESFRNRRNITFGYALYPPPPGLEKVSNLTTTWPVIRYGPTLNGKY